MTIDITKITPEKLAEMNDTLMVDNTHLREQLKEAQQVCLDYDRKLHDAQYAADESQKQNVMLRDALESAQNGLRWWMDVFPFYVTEADNEEMLRLVKALAATESELGRYILCEKEALK